MTAPLILASNSASRKALMTAAGLVYQAVAAEIDERQIEATFVARHANPEEIAKGLAVAKALEVSRRFPEAYVIGSDQTLSLGDRVFHKPRDMAEAGRHIVAFSGQTHHLNCGVAIARGGEVLWADVSIAGMTMRRLVAREIERYLEQAGPEILASVGAYQLEGLGIRLFEKIEGDYFTILGLPMLQLLKGLRELGAIDA